ncbi:MAG: hypothetical protein ACLUGQ_13995 [Coprococcus sp.]
MLAEALEKWPVDIL